MTAVGFSAHHSEKLKEPNEMNRFKKLFNISAKFINFPVKDIDAEIKKNLRFIGEFWAFDQIVITELSDDEKLFKTIYAYAAPRIKPPPFSLTVERFPWLVKRILAGESVVMKRLPEDLPHDAKEDRKFCVRGGLKSAIVLPLKVGPIIRGGFFLATLRKEGTWDDGLLTEIQYFGEILANVIDRKKAARRIEEMQHFDRLLCETSAAYINMPATEVDSTMKKHLGRLGRFLDADRCILYLVNDGTLFKPYLHSGWWPEKDNAEVTRRHQWLDENPEFFRNFKYLFDKWHRGEYVQWTQLDKLDSEGERMKKAHLKFETKCQLSIPIFVAGSIVGALCISDTRFCRKWPEDLIPRLRLFGELFANALARKQSEESLKEALSEVKQLKKRIEADYTYLREEIKLEHNFEEIIGQSAALKTVLLKVEQVAPMDTAVLIQGETGTGKELIARAIHNASKRSDRPLIKVNCASLTPSLIESELFGHEKGAFTGAATRRVGRFELADEATLFLDEIGELPLTLQPKLLRVLQDGEFERVGGSRTLKTGVRILAATNRDLQKEVEKGKFRKDLWYRLNTFPIIIPPLRERPEDIPMLVSWFVKKHANKTGKAVKVISQKTIRALQHYSWPGNVRELEHLIERALIMNSGGRFTIEVPDDRQTHPTGRTLEEINRDVIVKTLEDNDWIIQGPHGAAKRLGLKPSTLRNRMKKLGIERPSIKPQ